MPLESVEVAVQNVEARTGRDLHQRYQIDAVPLVVVADGTGAVRAHLLGPTTAAELWGALAGASPRRDAAPSDGGPEPAGVTRTGLPQPALGTGSSRRVAGPEFATSIRR